MQAIHALLHRNRIPEFRLHTWWSLSKDSPDWYGPHPACEFGHCRRPPLPLKFVKAGPRFGWSWVDEADPMGLLCDRDSCCEINWLDPEPSSDYEIYVEELQRIRQCIDIFNGFYEPPTVEEYRRLCEEHNM